MEEHLPSDFKLKQRYVDKIILTFLLKYFSAHFAFQLVKAIFFEHKNFQTHLKKHIRKIKVKKIHVQRCVHKF